MDMSAELRTFGLVSDEITTAEKQFSLSLAFLDFNSMNASKSVASSST